MAVVIRMRRVGRRNMDMFRIVVADKRFPRDGRFIEEVGHYNPNREPPVINIKKDRIDYWVGKGARLSEAVRNLVKKAGKTIPAN